MKTFVAKFTSVKSIKNILSPAKNVIKDIIYIIMEKSVILIFKIVKAIKKKNVNFVIEGII